MRDSEIVAAVAAGDPGGLAEAYDRYAAALYAYCSSLLAEPADAADAVQDTFIVAAAKLASIRDPKRLRPWLYAVARNECHRKLRTRAKAVALDEAGDVTDETVEVGAGAERAELRELVRAALTGLNDRERELIELNLRHELHGADLADALGVSRNQAHALASRARGQFEISLGALLVARSGRASCEDLNDMLAGWDGQLTVLLRKRLNRHIERCDICGERRRRELRPAMLLGLLPVAMLPDSLRQDVLRLVSDDTPGSTAYRARVAERAEPFGPSGFPVPIDPPGARRVPRRYALTAVAAAALLVALGGTVVAARLMQGAPQAAALPHAARTTAQQAQPFVGPASPSHASPVTSTPPTTPAPITPAPVTPAPATLLPSTPATSSSHTRSRRPPSTSHPPVTPGKLIASTSSLTLTSVNGSLPSGSFTLTATGGPVASYSISVPPDVAPSLTVSPSGGSLAAGQSVTITVTWHNETSPLSSQLTLTPGGATVSVSWQPPGT